MNRARFPQRHADGPTPLQPLARLSRVLGGANLFSSATTCSASPPAATKVRKGFFRKDENVLFVHTGGSPALYAYLDNFWEGL
jgi:1-aminocyclopropane-1-carboxylate deaminase/D-cysteine desulfhydrase-like pyridoxal-dependent ACC family enzyme